MIELHTLVCLAFLLICFTLWRNAAVETARQRLFEIRNEMFDFWAEHELPFENPAYVSLRGMINRSIRFAHNLAPSRFALTYFWYKYLQAFRDFKPIDFNRRFEIALETVGNEDAIGKLKNYNRSMNEAIGLLLFFGSISGLLFALMLSFYFSLKIIGKSGHILKLLPSSMNNESVLVGARAQNLALCAADDNSN